MTTTSIDTVASQLSESLQQAGIDNILEYLSKKPEDELRLKNQQRDEPDLTNEEKLGILREHLHTNPSTFLSRFGHHLNYSHLNSFHSICKKNFEVNFYIKELEKKLSPGVKKIQAKNRRYEALQKLVDTSDYFTEEEMQRRNPILYEQLIGRYHTKEEREAFLQLSAKAGSTSNGAKPTPLSDMLIAHMNRAPGEFSDRRIDQESQIHDEEVADYQYLNGNDGDEDEDDNCDINMEDQHRKDFVGSAEVIEAEEIEDEEKEVLKEEFFTTMYRSFLNGKDEDFDYTTIDNNPEYDCGETLDQDEEDKYFETDRTNSNSDIAAISECQCDEKQDDNESSKCEENGDRAFESEIVQVEGTHNMEDNDEEDELDLYMRGIEAELAKQK